MDIKLLDILACPKCGSNFGVIVTGNYHPVKEGILKCRQCKVEYPITNYIPRFVKTDEYVSNFSMEWDLFKKTQIDSISGTSESLDMFQKKTGFGKELKGKLVLDAGCGSGRFMEIAHNFGAEVIGVDLSYAVDSAQETLGLSSKVHFIQADINNLPFKKDVFDYIYSIGVLHHTPNTEQAFNSLVPLLQTGGTIAIWVYSSEGFKAKAFNFVSGIHRLYTTKMNKNMFYTLCKLAVPLYTLHKIPILGYFTIALFPCSMHPNPEWRILDTFDWYSPTYQWKHTFKEVDQWFADSGLHNIDNIPFAVAVKGTK